MIVKLKKVALNIVAIARLVIIFLCIMMVINFIIEIIAWT